MKSACILLFNDTLYIFFFQLALEHCDRVDENLLTWSRLNIVLEFFGTQVIWFRFSHITAEVLCYTFALGRLELFLGSCLLPHFELQSWMFWYLVHSLLFHIATEVLLFNYLHCCLFPHFEVESQLLHCLWSNFWFGQ